MPTRFANHGPERTGHGHALCLPSALLRGAHRALWLSSLPPPGPAGKIFCAKFSGNPHVKLSLQSILKLLQTMRRSVQVHKGLLRVAVALPRTISQPLVQERAQSPLPPARPLCRAQSWHRVLFEGSLGCLCHLTEADSSPNSHSYGFAASDIHLLPFKLNCTRLETEKTTQAFGR